MPLTLGTHWIVELFNCNPRSLERADPVKRIMTSAAKASNATVIESSFHEFKPHGVSGMVIIAESHLSIHTWPEHSYAAVDIFTCGATLMPEAAVEYLVQKFEAKKAYTYKILRGRFNNAKKPVPSKVILL